MPENALFNGDGSGPQYHYGILLLNSCFIFRSIPSLVLTIATLQSKETLPVPKQMYQACINKLEGTIYFY